MPDGASKSGIAAGGGVGGAVATIVIWILSEFFHIKLPPEVASAVTTIIIAICGWIGGLIGPRTA
jgi:hypothetical protein